MLATLIPDAIALAVCVVAATIDMRRRRIPNWLTVGAIACGLASNAVLGGGHGVAAALAGALLGFVVFGVPAAFDMVGMGDVKLVVALGALVRYPLALPLVLYIAIAGGAVALAYAAHVKQTRAVMPYGLAIAIGCAWAIASRYIAELRLLA